MVSHPSHYKGKVECITAMEIEFTKEEVAAFCKLNAYKYLWRKDEKGKPEEDAKKAIWYLNRLNQILFEDIGLPFKYTIDDIQAKVNKYK